MAVVEIEGLSGAALSGAVPSLLALATENFNAIGKTIADCFRRHDIESIMRLLEVKNAGIQILN